MSTDAPATTVVKAVEKGLNWKNLVTILIIVAVVIVVISLVAKQKVMLYDENGKQTHEGEVKFTLKNFKNPVVKK
jgi:hypothetical protein